jgi:hypothetical protein
LIVLLLLLSDRRSAPLQAIVGFGIAVIAWYEMMFHPWLAEVFW